MLSRRRFLGTTLGAGFSLAAPAFAQAPPRRRLIVDAQIHMWKANTPDRPWAPGTRAQLPEPMTIERVIPIMDEAGVDKVVIVPPTLDGWRYDYGQEAARRYPGRFATMGRIDLLDPFEERRLATWRNQPHLLGVRLNISGALSKAFVDGNFDWFWPAAEKANLPVMFLTNGQTALFGTIAERYPQLPLIIDHFGVSSEALHNNLLEQTIIESAALAKYPNVSIKLSSSTLLSKEAYPWRDMEGHIKRLFDVYGPRRCHWGTDFTNSFVKATMKQRIAHFTEELKFLSEDDKDWIMGKSILEKLRWT